MSLGLFKRENLIKAWNAYFVQNVQDLYPTLVGATEQARYEYNQYQAEDQSQQMQFADESNRDVNFGMGTFRQGASPIDGYTNPNSYFCHAMDQHFNVNNVAHRLYFNIGNNRIGFARALTYVCISRNIPFYYKWSKDGARADNIVVYIERDKIQDICNAIKDIAECNTHMMQGNRDLPMTAEDCGWFGYGVEDSDHSQSFSRKVTNGLRAAFDEICMAYNNDRTQIQAILDNPQTHEQFWQWAEYMIKQSFQQHNIPIDLSEQMPQEIKNLAHMQELYQSM